MCTKITRTACYNTNHWVPTQGSLFQSVWDWGQKFPCLTSSKIILMLLISLSSVLYNEGLVFAFTKSMWTNTLKYQKNELLEKIYFKQGPHYKLTFFIIRFNRKTLFLKTATKASKCFLSNSGLTRHRQVTDSPQTCTDLRTNFEQPRPESLFYIFTIIFLELVVNDPFIPSYHFLSGFLQLKTHLLIPLCIIPLSPLK